LHQDDTAFYPRGRCQTLLCILCPAADLPRCAYEISVSYLPNDMSPDPTKSRPCLECMPHLPSASLGAPSQPAIKEQQTIISNLQREWRTLSRWYVWGKGADARCIACCKTTSASGLCVSQRLVKLLGELLTVRDLAADASGMHLCRLHTHKPKRLPCAELLNHVGSHELPVPTVLHPLA